VDEEARPLPRREYRRKETEILFEIELLFHRWGVSDFILDEEGQVFRNRERRTVLSRHHANRDRLLSAANSETAG
jgi:hypothetical protein